MLSSEKIYSQHRKFHVVEVRLTFYYHARVFFLLLIVCCCCCWWKCKPLDTKKIETTPVLTVEYDLKTTKDKLLLIFFFNHTLDTGLSVQT